MIMLKMRHSQNLYDQDPYQDFCILDNNTNLYQPNNNPAAVPWFTLDLDKDPIDRWQEIGQKYGPNIKSLIGSLTSWLIPLLERFGINNGYNMTITFMETIIFPKIPAPYKDEIVGMANASGLQLGEIVIYNIFYEIFTVCTSIVANDDNGHIYHARNLDFGLLLGWDNQTHEWAVTERLRTMIFNLNWTRNGQTVFKSVQFAGYTGILSGMKEGGFTVTVDDRFMAEGGIIGLIRWLLGAEYKFTTWLTRELFENNTIASFNDALDHLKNTPIMAPVYYIVGGANPWEGAILARSLNQTDIHSQFNQTNAEDGWYLLETNYDQGIEVLYLDDRRTPGHACMKKLGRSNVGFQGLFNVMSSKSNLNMLTTYTVLMSAQTGAFETYIQTCSHPCYAW
uniref:Acid ceramidase n=1 Tax=Acrobeloides nanus TaxID=290746 RepID=A0A914CUA6_9BILA